ncbi:MAG: zinc carboxypeptidase [Pirellulaceae bacterium]|nr:zinc carboxypeptidase [Pirellulaceae bacterium]
MIHGPIANACLLQSSIILWISLALIPVCQAEELTYYLPGGASYSEKITAPADALGFEIGTRHIQHHELVAYARKIDEQSDRVQLVQYAQSHGRRPLVMMLISSEKNLRQLEKIRQQHLQLAQPDRSQAVDVQPLPAVIWMGYGVHGNEPSASNAAPLVMYHLAAAQGKEIDQLLDQTVVLLDPCLNPDGFDRFAQWANAHRGYVPNSDPQHREHREGSPTGRTNYYWFDLNRDWLPLQHPESLGRLALYHQWLPNVVLDFHEMGTDASYFFQPGVPTRMHPLTPTKNLELTREFAKEHTRQLDQLGALYFTEERFDDFYMGKGSTYPDLHGAVGILFEQASARGIKQESTNGLLTFAYAIRNQVTTSMTSLKATAIHREALHVHKRDFYRDAVALARNSKTAGYLFSAGKDSARADAFIDLLRRHGIRTHALTADIDCQGRRYSKSNSYFVPTEQAEYRFLEAMVEARTEFADKVFYDVTAWTFPMAYALQWDKVSSDAAASFSAASIGPVIEEPIAQGEVPAWQADDYAYLVDWTSHYAPRTLARLLENDIRVKVAMRPFTSSSDQGETKFEPGTLLIPLGIQTVPKERVRELLSAAAKENAALVTSASTGLTPAGVDLGSSSFITVPKPKVLLLVGSGVEDSEAGEIWYQLDHHLRMPVTLLESTQLGAAKLDDVTTIVMVSGTYNQVSEAGVERLQSWLKRGGTLIAIGTASKWLIAKQITSMKVRTSTADPDTNRKPERANYADAEDQAALEKIEGTIFEVQVDRTHPVGFGFQSVKLPIFRDQALYLEPSANIYSTPAIYSPQPLLSGYASENNQKLAAGSAAALVKAEGAGRVIAMTNNPNFRCFWLGSQRLLTNSLFFGPIVREP